MTKQEAINYSPITSHSSVDEFQYYSIVGSAACPFFARAERLAQLLTLQLNATQSQIIILATDPAKFDAVQASLASKWGFSTRLSELSALTKPSSEYNKARCIVFCPSTGRLVGGEREFRQEMSQKYGIECDIQWPQLLCIAQENEQSFYIRDKTNISNASDHNNSSNVQQ
jgi:hypothetical protein